LALHGVRCADFDDPWAGGNSHNFTYALTKESKDGYRVIVIDRPVCGWPERDGAKQATLPEQARMIAEFIETEELGGLCRESRCRVR